MKSKPFENAPWSTIKVRLLYKDIAFARIRNQDIGRKGHTPQAIPQAIFEFDIYSFRNHCRHLSAGQPPLLYLQNPDLSNVESQMQAHSDNRI